MTDHGAGKHMSPLHSRARGQEGQKGWDRYLEEKEKKKEEEEGGGGFEERKKRQEKSGLFLDEWG